jgi:hypothetical protein
MNRPESQDNFSAAERAAYEFELDCDPFGEPIEDLNDWHDRLDESADEDWREHDEFVLCEYGERMELG